MAITNVLSAKGLYTFQNFLSSVPDGSMYTATNVVIDRDGVIEPRRGIKILGQTYDIPKQLLTFKDTILAHSGNVIEYGNNQDPATFTSFKGKTDFSETNVDLTDNRIIINLHELSEGDKVTFSTEGTLPSPLQINTTYFVRNPDSNTFQLSLALSGPITALTSIGTGTVHYNYVFKEVVENLRVKYIELNGNLYVTTIDGIKKIEQLSEYSVRQAGTVQALDLSLRLDISTELGFLPDAKECAYRMVWGVKDVNDNLILGAPSSRFVIQNNTGAGRNVFITFIVPEEITTDYFYQIYRSQDADINASGDEMNLVYEAPFTSGTSITVLDQSPEDIRNSGVPLYTNEFSGDGLLAANNRPPIAQDISIYKNTAFFANTVGLHTTDDTLLGLDGLQGMSITSITGANPATVTTSTPHGFLNTDSVAIVGAGNISDTYIVSNITSTTFQIPADSADYNGAAPNVPTAYGAYIQVTKNGTVNKYLFVGLPEFFDVTFASRASITHSSYFLFNSAEQDIKYCFYSDTTGHDAKPTLSPSEGTERVFIKLDFSVLGDQDFESANVSLDTDVITVVNNKFTNYDIITFKTTDSLPAPLLTATNYYALNVSQNSFQVAYPTKQFTIASTDINTTDDTITRTNHGFIEGDILAFAATGTLPTGIVAGQNYYVVHPTTNTFKLNRFKAADVTDPTEYDDYIVDFTDQGVGPFTIDNIVNFLTQGSLTGEMTVNNIKLGTQTDVAEIVKTTVEKTGDFQLDLTDANFSIYTGIIAGTTTSVTITADNEGTTGNSVVLTFNGTDTIAETITAWNAANNANTITLTSGDGSQIPTAGTTSLAGGTNPTGVLRSADSGTTQIAGFVSGQAGGALSTITLTALGQGLDVTKNYVKLSSLLSRASAIEVTTKSLIYLINLNLNDGITGIYTSDSVSYPGAFEFVSKTSSDILFNTLAIYQGTELMFFPDLSGDGVDSKRDSNPNKLYFSKTQQPEAVPLTNSFLIGPKDKKIIRILGLRESLFIFKEEGIYRLTGTDSTNFSVSLFDSSAQILAADTACILNNQIYLLSTQGVVYVNEAGVEIVSRPIENIMLGITAPAFINFSTQCFGLSYESDRSYLIFIPTDPTDISAQAAYRYNTFTQSWTSWDKTNTCGVVESSKNLLYLGASDTNAVEIERKTLTTRDYADREYNRIISYFDYGYIYVDDASNMVIGDCLTQFQTLSLATLNGLINKLNIDVSIDVTIPEIGVAEDIKVKLASIITTLNASDTGIKTKTFDLSTISANTITINNHGFNLNDIVSFTGTTFDGIDYYIINPTTNTFQISLTKNGAVNPITASTGMATVSNQYIYVNVDYSALGTLFNRIVNRLNQSTGVYFADFKTTSGTTYQDLTIIKVDRRQNRVQVRSLAAFYFGPVTHYKRIQSTVAWNFNALSNPSMSKHVREGVVLIENRNFAHADVGFASDLSGNYEDIPFNLAGKGVWGESAFGSTVWGGQFLSPPLRTLIPRQKQRCRYISTRFMHYDAFYKFSITGIAYTYEMTSERAWR